MNQKQYVVYILASRRNGTLYTGITSNLETRMWKHHNQTFDGFTKNYEVHRLVHVELFDDIRDAIAREKQLKRWNRAWKIELIEKENRDWRDLSGTSHEDWLPGSSGQARG